MATDKASSRARRRARTARRFSADAKAHIESIHASTADQSTELRKRADDDIAGIREWSKQEIARIREETDERVTHRKDVLEREIEAHAAEIESRIERVQAHVATFESEMAAFFERLLGEDDPTRFAAMAETLLPAAIRRPTTPGRHGDDRRHAGRCRGAVEAAPVDEEPRVGGRRGTRREPASRDRRAGSLAGQPGGASRKASLRPPQKAAARDATWTTVTCSAGDDARRRDGPAPHGARHGERLRRAERGRAFRPRPPTPMRRSEYRRGCSDARLAGLVAEDQRPDRRRLDALVVTGLVSVASIAGFKRSLSRVTGVRSVGVSSGPDGEFVFAVTHDPDLGLADAITTLPGFGARVTDEAPGELTVAARDPESEG